jgi:hypothetical protein
MPGRVIDSATQAPVEHATVSFHEHPSTKARTDRDGFYQLPATHHLTILLAGGICGSEIPFGKDYVEVLDVRHPLYETMQIQAAEHRDPMLTNTCPMELRDIILEPVAKP